MQVWNHLGLSNGSLLCTLSIPRQLEGVSTGSSCGCAGPQRAGDNDDPSLRKVVIQGTKEQIARCDKFSFEKPNWMKVGECCSTRPYQERMRCFGAILFSFLLQICLFRCKEAINGVLMGEEPKAWYFSFVTQDTKSKVTPTFWQLARMCWHSWMERCLSRSWADQWVKVYTSYSLTGHPGTWVFAAYTLRTARTHIVEHKLQSWQSDFMQ